MNGAQHYIEAERLFALASQMTRDLCDPSNPLVMAGCAEIANVTAAAQVHATLALSAATAEPLLCNVPDGAVADAQRRAWREVLK